MQATEFEFRYRIWVIGGLFSLAFSFYWLDHQNAAIALLAALSGHGIKLESSPARWQLHLIFGIADIVVILAALLRTWGTAYLRSNVVHDPAMHSRELMADGPFRHVRNPLYLGTLILAIGLGMLASRLGWLVAVAGMWLFLYRLIWREEQEMRRQQGGQFDAYCAKVPRLLISLRPRIPPGNGIPHWKQALLGESFCWAFALGAGVFAVTLNVVYAYCTFVIGFLGGIVLRQLSHRLGRD